MLTLLAVDVGGTKTLLRLVSGNDDVIIEKRLENASYPTFEALLAFFLASQPAQEIATVCVAVAGPVNGRQAKLTNLDWHIDADQVANQLTLSPRAVRLCNDFEALAAAIPALSSEQYICLQSGESDTSAPVAIIGAGTGLGQAYTLPGSTGQWQVFATEGGHTDFAPTDALQQQLLDFVLRDYAHVSYERLLSGAGIGLIYRFLANNAEQPVTLETPAEISKAALSRQDQLACQTLDLFAKVYGAQAGNLALTLMSRGGVFIAGGIAPKILPKLTDGTFMTAFLAKGRMQSLMKTFPVYVITDTSAGLTGATVLARQAMYNETYD